MSQWIGSNSSAVSALAALLIVAAAKSAVVLLIAGAASLALGRSSAALRHLVWTLALAGVFGLPALSAALPGWRLELPAPRGSDRAAALLSAASTAFALAPSSRSNPDEIILVTAARPPISLTPGTSPVAPASPEHEREVPLARSDRFSALGAAAALAAWASGALVCMVPVVLGLLGLRKLRCAARPVTDAGMLQLLETLAARVGVSRRVRLLRSSDREIPMTWGVFRPVILLPEDAEGWSSERLSVALLHELAHVKRWDCLSQLLARVACACHWFDPLTWIALRRVRVEQEQASDDLVLRGGLDPLEYADHLLAIVTGRSTGGASSLVAPAMAPATRLERRLIGILDSARCRKGVGRGCAGLVSIVAACLVAGLAALSLQTAAEARGDEPLKGPTEVLKTVREAYVKPTDESALRAGAIKGMIDALHDPYSEFYDTPRVAELERDMQNKLTGIGAQLKVEKGEIVVITPLPDSPAFKAGLRPGDVIESVDGKATKGVALAEVVKQIIGPAGTVVRLSVRHADSRTEEMAITRGTITVRTVRGFWQGEGGQPDFLLDRDHAIGYMSISHFAQGTADELKASIEALKAKGIKGLMLDLRGCPGGLMTEAVETAKVFLSKGTIVSIRGRDAALKSFAADAPAPAGDLPLVVLIDERTGSASEIVAGSLKDHDRAVLVGTRTLGKGSVQTIIKLDDGGAIRLTTAYYELPSGKNIDKQEGKLTWGVDPTDGDYIPLSAAEEEALEKKRSQRERVGAPVDPKIRGAKVTPEWLELEQSDRQLAAALETLIARIATGNYVKVGLPASELVTRVKRLDDARKRRESLRKELEKLDEELASLRGVEPAAKK